MSEGSQTGISLIKETVFGVVPTAQFKGMNFVDESLKFEIDSTSSNSVRPDRQNAGVIRKSADTSGAINTELQAVNTDYILPAFLWADADWAPAGTIAGLTQFTTETGTGVGGVITFAAGDAIDILKGQFISITTATEANSGIFKVLAVTGQDVQVNSPLATEVDVAGVVLAGDRIRNGVTKQSFSIERALYDVSQFFVYKGMVPNEWELNIESEEIIESNFTFVGQDDEVAATSFSAGSPTALSTLTPLSSSVSVGSVYRNDVEFDQCEIMSVKLKINNQAEGRKCVGFFGNGSVRGKSLEVTGEIVLYFKDKTEYERYKAGTAFSFDTSLFDDVGNIYIISFVKNTYNEATVNVTGKDDDVMFESTFISSVGDDNFTVEIVRILA